MGAANLDTRVPAWFVCRHLGITPQTLNYWRTSGKLTPTTRDSASRPLYRFGDVLAAEQQTRRSPNSRRGCSHSRATTGASRRGKTSPTARPLPATPAAGATGG